MGGGKIVLWGHVEMWYINHIQLLCKTVPKSDYKCSFPSFGLWQHNNVV